MPEQQHITDGKVVTMQYALTNAQGVVVREASGTPVSYVHGAGILFARLEQALAGHAVGDIVTARLLPDDAFGKRNISIAAALQKGDCVNGYVPVVYMTHEARESDIRQALAEIGDMDVVETPPVVLRIEG